MDSAYETGNEAAEKPDEATERQKALVTQWLGRIEAAKKHHETAFKEMKKSQDFALYGADKEWIDAGKYTVPILPRYINQAVSALYARNPKVTYKRRRRMSAPMWDGRPDSLQAAMEMAQMGDASSIAMIQQVMAVRQRDMMLDRMGETLELVWQYYLDEQGANYKQQLKAWVRRAKICKVAYVKLGFQRILKRNPEIGAQIVDVTTKLAAVQRLAAKSDLDPDSADAAELENTLRDLQSQEMLVTREGPVLDFPRSDHIIVDPACTHLKSFTGARWVAHMFEYEPCDVKEIWGYELGSEFKAYDPEGKDHSTAKEGAKKVARLYEVWDKKLQEVFVVCEGHPGFVKAPAEPDVWTERFWPFFPLVFNEAEHHDQLYPRSDVEQAEHIQKEFNRSKDQLRQHRIAARPYYVVGGGIEQQMLDKLANHADHEIIVAPALTANQKVADLVQAGPTAPIDPNLYEVEQHFVDLTRVVGYQEAQIGAMSGGTATEASIAQQSNAASTSDQVDDIDEVLNDLSRAGAQVLLMNISKDTVIEIVGEGAVWPDSPITREAAAKEIFLEIEAGSTGRPNQAAELANLERAMPIIQNMPGAQPTPFLKKYVNLLNLGVSTEEAIAEGLPSMTAMNAIMAKMAAGGNGGAQPTGDPRTDPNSQGAQGAQNAPSTQTNEPGPQPGYPA